MKISIIIPLYNSQAYIGNCLDSVLMQDLSLTDFEIIIVDDGSTDRSLEMVNKYAKKHKNISVYTKANGGVGSARNLGLSKAQGNYVYFLDSDDYLLPNVLEALVDIAHSNALEILTFQSIKTHIYYDYGAKPNLDDRELSAINNGIDYIAENNYKNEVWWYLIEKSFLEQSRIKFKNGWMEDAIFTTQLFLKAKRIAKIPAFIHRHLKVKDSAMTSREPQHYIDVIYGNKNAASTFEGIIDDLKGKKENADCIERIRTRQQSFVFFMMLRTLKSSLELEKVKEILNDVSKTNAYPLNSFVGKDYNGLPYVILTKIFNRRSWYYFIFRILNPILK